MLISFSNDVSDSDVKDTKSVRTVLVSFFIKTEFLKRKHFYTLFVRKANQKIIINKSKIMVYEL